MSFERRMERALAIMESKNMWRCNYAPPLLRGLWRLGVKIPPLPFVSFWQITLIMGLMFGLLWGLIVWFSSWKEIGVQPLWAILWSQMGGILFGVLMATFHGWRKKANKLPDWQDL